MPTNNFYPSLSTLLSFDKLPKELGFVNNFFDSIFYQNLQIHKSVFGEKVRYNIEIITDDLSLKLGSSEKSLNHFVISNYLVCLRPFVSCSFYNRNFFKSKKTIRYVWQIAC